MWAKGQPGEGVFGRLVDPQGGEGEAFPVETGDGPEVNAPTVSTNADGGFVVGWEKAGQGGGVFGRVFDPGQGEEWDIFARRVAGGGQTLDPQLKVNTDTVGSQTRPTVTMNVVGDFAVAWESGSTGNTSIYGRLFGADGHPLGRQFEIATPTGGSVPELPRLTLQALDRLTAAYTRAEATSRTLVFRQFSVTTSPGSCETGVHTLCLNSSRFSVEVTWRDLEGTTGAGTAVPLTEDTGYFWFFTDTNVELIVKVLDGRWLNGHYWVFYGALSNIEYTLTVTDTITGQVRSYLNPLEEFGSVGDTTAFPAP